MFNLYYRLMLPPVLKDPQILRWLVQKESIYLPITTVLSTREARGSEFESYAPHARISLETLREKLCD